MSVFDRGLLDHGVLGSGEGNGNQGLITTFSISLPLGPLYYISTVTKSSTQQLIDQELVGKTSDRKRSPGLSDPTVVSREPSPLLMLP